MSRKFVTEEQLSEVVDLIVEQEKFTVDKTNRNFDTVKGWIEEINNSPRTGAEELDEEELNEISENWGDPKNEADHVVNPPSL